MTELTEAETEALYFADPREPSSLVAAVERLIDARLAPIRALLEHQLGCVRLGLPCPDIYEDRGDWCWGCHLDAALSAPLTAPDATDGPQGHRDAAEAREGDMCPNCLTPWKCNGPHLTEETR